MEGTIMIKDRIRGMQHIGLPTNDMKKTIEFYEALGFQIATRHDNGGVDVVFLTLGNVCVETYENGQAALCHGAIDHICLDVDDVEKAWDEVVAAGFTPIESEIQALPFWSNGVRFFNILGPNHEKIEFGQIL
jgi:catechol 2,3-dioxygenase-like lactoylglutathione lyase family enzyme